MNPGGKVRGARLANPAKLGQPLVSMVPGKDGPAPLDDVLWLNRKGRKGDGRGLVHEEPVGPRPPPGGVLIRPPKLTSEQLEKLHVLEPALRSAALAADYKSAQKYAAEVQTILRATGHETRLMQSKVWLFEAALEAGNFDIAEAGFVGVRAKCSKGTRLHLEATALLAICYLRQKKIGKAEPLVAEALNSRNIKSEFRRRQFVRSIVSRFEEEGLLGTLVGQRVDRLDPNEIEDLAAALVRTKNEDEILFEMGNALPPESTAFLLKVDMMAKRGLTRKELLYLPGEAQIMQRRSSAERLFIRSSESYGTPSATPRVTFTRHGSQEG
jgi:hypothetical protein